MVKFRRMHLAGCGLYTARLSIKVGLLILRRTGGYRGGAFGLHLRLNLRLGTLLQREVHPEGDGGGGAVLLKTIQVPAWEYIHSSLTYTQRTPG